MTSILLVEDESGIAETVVFALQREGYQVTHCVDGRTALATFADHQLVILDIGLPDISGFVLFGELRRQRDVPVIFLSARVDEVDRVVGLELGGDDYIGKPFSPRELVARVRSVLRRSQNNAAEQSVVLDTTAQCLRYQGRQIAVTAAEYRLFAVLATHPGQVLNRSQLLAQVFGDTHPSGERSIDTLVKSLRAALREAGVDEEYIYTHRGIGYSYGA